MNHVMFDIDGTLVYTDDFEGDCYNDAIYKVFGNTIDTDWSKYTHVSATGILDEVIIKYGLKNDKGSIHAAVKEQYMQNIAKYINKYPVEQISGAGKFIELLQKTKGIHLSIATGGWKETAIMKLQSANIDVSNIPIASSNDHFSRIEIMKIAKEKAIGNLEMPCTYFGDGIWDKMACEALGFNFVLVGEKTTHNQKILDFTRPEQAMSYIGV